MALELIETPRRADTPIASDVAAALTQLPYRFKRKDDTIISSINSGGFQLINTTNLSPIGVEVGQKIYVFGANLELGVAYITAIGIRTITTNIPWTVDIGAGFINYNEGVQGYKILLEPVNAITGESYFPYPESFSPDEKGDLFLSVSALLAVVEINAVALNYRLRYSEYYNGIIQSTATDLAVFAVAARKQLLDIGGSNMWEFLLNADPLAKVTSKFKNAIYWRGWRTNLYAIWDSNLYVRAGADSIGFRYRALDKNKNQLFEMGASVTGDPIPKIYHDWIPPEIEDVENIYFVEVFAATNTQIPLSESLLYEVKKPCANPIMLEWVNGNGVGEQWLFDVMQEEEREALAGQSYEKPITDTIDNVHDTVNRLSLGTVQRITLFADQLTPDQIRALHGIKESLYVLLWLDKTGEKKIKVVVESLLSTSINTKAVFGSYSCQIKLPRNFDFYKNE